MENTLKGIMIGLAVVIGVQAVPWILAGTVESFTAAHAWYCKVNGLDFTSVKWDTAMRHCVLPDAK